MKITEIKLKKDRSDIIQIFYDYMNIEMLIEDANRINQLIEEHRENSSAVLEQFKPYIHWHFDACRLRYRLKKLANGNVGLYCTLRSHKDL